MCILICTTGRAHIVLDNLLTVHRLIAYDDDRWVRNKYAAPGRLLPLDRLSVYSTKYSTLLRTSHTCPVYRVSRKPQEAGQELGTPMVGSL